MMATDLLDQILPHIKESVYPVRMALSDWRMKEGEIKDAASASLNDKSWTSIRIPFHWGKYDRIYWFRQTLKIQPELSGKPLVLLLDFPEAMVYLNEKPYQGIDKNHNEILIREKAKPDEEILIAIQAYSGKKHEHSTFNSAEIAVLDTTARRLGSGLGILRQYNDMLEHGSQESKEIKELIRRTLIYLKYFRPGSEEYPNAIRRAYNFLLNTLETEFKTTLPGLIHLIGYSHIHSACTWNESETVRKYARSFASALRLMEEFPEFKFSSGYPAYYESVKTAYPDIYKQLKQRIAEGKWELLGPMWTAADCIMPGGESIVRQIMYGKKFLKQEFGIDTDIFWLPDSFGFHASLPQIISKCGISGFYTSLFLQDESAPFPYSSFAWQGIDKTTIPAYLSRSDYASQITPEYLLKNAEQLQEQVSAPAVLQTYGCSDIGPTKENLEHAVVLKTIVGLTTSQLSSAGEFFRQLREHQGDLPQYIGDLVVGKNRGVFTNDGWIKKENRECETLLYNTELLSSLSMLFGKNSSARRYPKKELEAERKKLLANQAKHIISGACREEYHKDIRDNYRSVRDFCSHELLRCISGLSQNLKKNRKEFHYSLFNPLGWPRTEYIEILVNTSEKNVTVADDSGNILPHQVTEKTKKWQKLLCFVEEIPPFGFKNITVRIEKKGSQEPAPQKSSLQGIETPFYRIKLNRRGELSSVYAKFLHRELFEKGKCGNQLLIFHDALKQGDIWNIDPDYEKHRSDILRLKQVKILNQGPLRFTIHVEYKTANGSYIEQEVHFYRDSQQIDFFTKLHWQEKQALMKASFPFNIRTANLTHDIPFGFLSRPSKVKADNNSARLDFPARLWADLSDAKFGISLLNDCKHGYDAHDNTIKLTLVRSPRYPALHEGGHSEEGFTDQGDHVFRYALYPHPGNPAKGSTVLRAYEFNNPVLVFPDAKTMDIQPLLVSSKQNIIIECIKKAEEEDSIIIRVYEAGGLPTDTVFHLGTNPSSIFECDLLENDQKPLKIAKSKLSLKFKPFEIKTLKIALKGNKKTGNKK